MAGSSRDKDGRMPEKSEKAPEALETKPEEVTANAAETTAKPAAKPPERLPDVLRGLAERLDVAERRYRRLRWRSAFTGLLSLLALVVGAAALLAPYNAQVRTQLDRILRRADIAVPQSATLEAERLVLRDAAGDMRAELAPRKDGTLAFALYDTHGNLRTELSVDAGGLGGFRLAGENGQPGLVVTPKSLRFADTDGAAFLASTSLGLTAWGVGDARSGVWIGTRPDGTSAVNLADRQGRTRAGVALKGDGSPSLTLNDQEGRTGAVLDVPADGARLGLFSEGTPRAAMGYGAGGPQLGLYGADGKERAALRYLNDGTSGVFLLDAEGHERIQMGVRPNGGSGMSLLDRKGVPRAVMSTVADESPNLVLFDAGGVRRASLGLNGDGAPGLRFEDKGRPRAVLNATGGERAGVPGPPAFVLYDKDGTILFQAPVY